MQITQMKTGCWRVVRDNETLFVPNDPGNRDYHMVQQAIADGTVVEMEPSASVSQEVRSQRNGLLSSSDWTQVADAPVDHATWAVYRQALRDVPQQAGFPDNVVWPVKP